jgi:hypothetical protein
MNDLGRIEDLPPDYVQDLRNVNLVPLWPSLRGVLPPNVPTRQTQPTPQNCSAAGAIQGLRQDLLEMRIVGKIAVGFVIGVGHAMLLMVNVFSGHPFCDKWMSTAGRQGLSRPFEAC